MTYCFQLTLWNIFLFIVSFKLPAIRISLLKQFKLDRLLTSNINCGICVLFPLPVSPAISMTECWWSCSRMASWYWETGSPCLDFRSFSKSSVPYEFIVIKNIIIVLFPAERREIFIKNEDNANLHDKIYIYVQYTNIQIQIYIQI